MSVKVRAGTVLAGAALAALGGCVDYEAAVDLRADGSGRLVVHYSSKDYFTIFDSDWSWEHGKEKRVPPEDVALYQYRFTKPGQRVVDVRARDQGGLHHTYIIIEFDDVNQLEPGDVSRYQNFYLRDEYGKLYFRSVITPPERNLVERGKFLLQKPKLEGHYFTLRVRMPARVTTADGSVEDDGRTVRWTYPMERVADGEPITMTATCPKPVTVLGLPAGIAAAVVAGVVVAGLAAGAFAVIVNRLKRRNRK